MKIKKEQVTVALNKYVDELHNVISEKYVSDLFDQHSEIYEIIKLFVFGKNVTRFSMIFSHIENRLKKSFTNNEYFQIIIDYINDENSSEISNEINELLFDKIQYV
jgi:hypothetical protein